MSRLSIWDLRIPQKRISGPDDDDNDEIFLREQVLDMHCAIKLFKLTLSAQQTPDGCIDGKRTPQKKGA